MTNFCRKNLPIVSFIFCVFQTQNFNCYVKIANTANIPNKVVSHALYVAHLPTKFTLHKWKFGGYSLIKGVREGRKKRKKERYTMYENKIEIFMLVFLSFCMG